jgi:L-ribulose-5-phosphate 4-epimerase
MRNKRHYNTQDTLYNARQVRSIHRIHNPVATIPFYGGEKMLEKLKNELLSLLQELPKNNLVCLTSGNVSARDPETGLIVIKPSGIPYAQLDENQLVVLTSDGKIVEGKCKPSSDTASHLYIYQHRADVNGIVHTHSMFATVFAALGKNIPVLITETAEEFGGEIPCAEFVLIGDNEIGKQIVKHGEHCNAVLLKNMVFLLLLLHLARQ